MITNLIRIRLRQIRREMVGIGLLRVMVLLVMVFLLLAFMFLQTSKLPNALYASAIVWLLILLLHRNREDKQFLSFGFNHFRWIFYLEYLAISIILVVFLLIHKLWLLSLLAIVIPLVIAHVDIGKGQTRYHGRLLQWIPLECMEWRGGMRRMLPIVATVWLAGIVFSFFVGSVPAALLVIGVIVLNFYERCEPYPMLTALEKSPDGLLALKIRQHTYLVTLLSLPLMASFLVFHFSIWYVPFLIFILLYILQIYSIIAKYAFYEPNSKSLAAQLLVGIGFIGLIIPIFAPLVLLLMLRFYFKAKQKLNFYLNDFH